MAIRRKGVGQSLSYIEIVGEDNDASDDTSTWRSYVWIYSEIVLTCLMGI